MRTHGKNDRGRRGTGAAVRGLVIVVLALLAGAAALQACAGETVSSPDQTAEPAVSSGEEASMTEGTAGEAESGSEGEILHGKANVESVEVARLESYPTQIRVTASGYLPDGCTEIDQVRQAADPEAERLEVAITTARPADAMCTQAIVPFEEAFHLDVVYGLPTGTYTLDVNGVERELVLRKEDVDQISPGDGG